MKAPSTEEELKLILKNMQRELILKEVKESIIQFSKEFGISIQEINDILNVDIRNMKYIDVPQVLRSLPCFFPSLHREIILRIRKWV